ncbi:MAG TPA: hypothetical protein VMJ70_04355 [Candidatus Sulfotelmatobacter sp.]|nr:hypothetical protein [Candidatus Sulfotelmatobacter sp.]
MKRKALLLIFTACLAFATRAGADQLLFGFTGFDYQDPNLDGTYLDVGEGYNVIGFVTGVGLLLDPYFDDTVNQYTIQIHNLTVTSRTSLGSLLAVNFANGGRASYFADPLLGGTNATYGINPPNATAPSTFIDGSMRITGSVDNFVLTYNFSTNQGSFSGNMTVDGGPDADYVPAEVRSGWVLGGLSGNGLSGPPNATVPTGYDHQVSGECRHPDVTSATHATWGAVKALYR